MEKNIQRRILHILGCAFIAYYFFPEITVYSISKSYILLIVLLIIFVIELKRIQSNRSHILDSLIREYENNRPASYTYFAFGSILLLLIFPQYITIPCILSAAFCDPITGILKQKNKKLTGIFIGFIISFIIFSIVWSSTPIWIMFIASLSGASSLIYAENISSFYIDDDFLMQVLPALFLSLFTFVLIFFSLPVPNKIIYPF